MGDFMAASDSTSTGSAESTASTVSKPLNATGASSSVFGSAPVISSGQSGTAASTTLGEVEKPTGFGGRRASRRGGKRASRRGGSRSGKRGGKRASKRGGKRSSRRGGSRASRR